MDGGGAAPRIRLIGVVSVTRGDHVTEVSRSRQAAVLAVLALRAGKLVPRDALLRAVWGDDGPESSVGNLHTYVSGLRRGLERDPGDRLVLRAEEGGYRLCVPEGHVDVLEFDRLTGVAKAAWAEGDAAGCFAALDAADELWRGTPLPGTAGPFAEQERSRLQRSRVVARGLRAEALLGSGQPERAAVECSGLVRENPLDERLAALFSASLFRSGRVDDALAELVALRARLRTELGVRPGPETVRLHEEIIASQEGAGPGAVVCRPAQTPHRPWGFVGRGRALADLSRLVNRVERAVLVTGHAGIGKTAMAVEFAHRNRDAFPDGQTFLNLRGTVAGGPLSADGVLEHQLRAFGIDAPDGVEAKAAQLSAFLAKRRALLLLDDVTDLAQVRPLVAGHGRSTLLLTSRYQLSGAGAVRRIPLAGLEPEAARDLLCGHAPAVSGDERLGTVAARCGYVPLALRAASLRLGTELGGFASTSCAGLLDELDDEAIGWGALTVDDDATSVLHGIEEVCRGLSAPAGELLVRLSKLPEPEFDWDPLPVSPVAELREAGLLELGVPGRGRVPALVRGYALGGHRFRR
ncbi:AfsR/SARP family transcriptional regulator [Amycolatopsis minnesotensis]|uniref:AfsR/SARP family transcriptional regulator n=1 Tax=Amycolatopsis minnesotensis TaxID=337894 RepID=UPI0031D1E69E